MNEEILKQALQKWGAISQLLQTAEECTELATAIIRVANGRGSRNDVIEELADVHIMMRQMMMVFNTSGEVDSIVQQKIERLQRRISEHDNGVMGGGARDE